MPCSRKKKKFGCCNLLSAVEKSKARVGGVGPARVCLEGVIERSKFALFKTVREFKVREGLLCVFQVKGWP